jgi:hypothetical protein
MAALLQLQLMLLAVMAVMGVTAGLSELAVSPSPLIALTAACPNSIGLGEVLRVHYTLATGLDVDGPRSWTLEPERSTPDSDLMNLEHRQLQVRRGSIKSLFYAGCRRAG